MCSHAYSGVRETRVFMELCTMSWLGVLAYESGERSKGGGAVSSREMGGRGSMHAEDCCRDLLRSFSGEGSDAIWYVHA